MLICGVDEAGRGAWAGPVYAAAVILDPDNPVDGLNDSKKLSEKRRECLYDEIKDKALNYCVAASLPSRIDQVNIFNATMEAMTSAFNNCVYMRRDIINPGEVRIIIDGDSVPRDISQAHDNVRAVIKADMQYESVMAASILAKVERDRYMANLEIEGFDFKRHKGYGTKLHREELARSTKETRRLHRMTFKPMKDMI